MFITLTLAVIVVDGGGWWGWSRRVSLHGVVDGTDDKTEASGCNDGDDSADY